LFPAPKLRMLDRVSQFAAGCGGAGVASARLAFDARTEAGSVSIWAPEWAARRPPMTATSRCTAEGSERVKPYSVLMAMTNAAASWIGIEYGLTGPNLTYLDRVLVVRRRDRRSRAAHRRGRCRRDARRRRRSAAQSRHAGAGMR
jgi:hypothetical protein